MLVHILLCILQLPVQVCKLFNVTAILHTPSGVGNARISHHYRASFMSTFFLHRVSVFAVSCFVLVWKKCRKICHHILWPTI